MPCPVQHLPFRCEPLDYQWLIYGAIWHFSDQNLQDAACRLAVNLQSNFGYGRTKMRSEQSSVSSL